MKIMTTLLFPYVVTRGPSILDDKVMDSKTFRVTTGIVITNASAEPFGKPQAGKCDVHFFGKVIDGGLTPPTMSAQVEPGAQYFIDLLMIVSGFNGYVVAECSFDDAYGFAHIFSFQYPPFDREPADTFTSGYLAQRIPNRRSA